jgi:hypothetical protein
VAEAKAATQDAPLPHSEGSFPELGIVKPTFLCSHRHSSFAPSFFYNFSVRTRVVFWQGSRGIEPCLVANRPLTRHAPADESAGARHPLPKGEGCYFLPSLPRGGGFSSFRLQPLPFTLPPAPCGVLHKTTTLAYYRPDVKKKMREWKKRTYGQDAEARSWGLGVRRPGRLRCRTPGASQREKGP